MPQVSSALASVATLSWLPHGFATRVPAHYQNNSSYHYFSLRQRNNFLHSLGRIPTSPRVYQNHRLPFSFREPDCCFYGVNKRTLPPLNSLPLVHLERSFYSCLPSRCPPRLCPAATVKRWSCRHGQTRHLSLLAGAVVQTSSAAKTWKCRHNPAEETQDPPLSKWPSR